MPNCKYCGKWACFFDKEHLDCAFQAEQGDPPVIEPPERLTAGRIFWAIFGALWAYSLSAAVVYFLFRLIVG